jgi:hypothetical protein
MDFGDGSTMSTGMRDVRVSPNEWYDKQYDIH